MFDAYACPETCFSMLEYAWTCLSMLYSHFQACLSMLVQLRTPIVLYSTLWPKKSIAEIKEIVMYSTLGQKFQFFKGGRSNKLLTFVNNSIMTVFPKQYGTHQTSVQRTGVLKFVMKLCWHKNWFFLWQAEIFLCHHFKPSSGDEFLMYLHILTLFYVRVLKKCNRWQFEFLHYLYGSFLELFLQCSRKLSGNILEFFALQPHYSLSQSLAISNSKHSFFPNSLINMLGYCISK